jgi:hypothetical protein
MNMTMSPCALHRPEVTGSNNPTIVGCAAANKRQTRQNRPGQAGARLHFVSASRLATAPTQIVGVNVLPKRSVVLAPTLLEIRMASKLFGLLLITLTLATTTCARMIWPDSSKMFRPYLAALNVKDASKAAEWYRQNLGFQITKTMDFPQHDSLRIVFLKLDVFELELIQNRTSFDITKYVPNYDQEKAPIRGIAKLAFMVQNVRLLADTLRLKKVKILYGPFDDKPFSIRSVIIEDLEGNLLQFSEPLTAVSPGK